MSTTIVRYLSILALGLGVVLTSACATIVEGTDQSVTVTTEPSGASCSLQRDGKTVGVVNPTPGTVSVDKSQSDIAVSCEKQGQLPAAAVLSSQFQGMTLGNALIGGIIGFGIDAASGAMNEYPTNIMLHLPPDSFSSDAERNAYFDGRIAEIEADYPKAIEAAENGARCHRDPDGTECQRLKSQIAEARDLEIETVERQRQIANIQSGDGATAGAVMENTADTAAMEVMEAAATEAAEADEATLPYGSDKETTLCKGQHAHPKCRNTSFIN